MFPSDPFFIANVTTLDLHLISGKGILLKSNKAIFHFH